MKRGLLVGALVAGMTRSADASGILGYVGDEGRTAATPLSEGFTVIKSRGYDSAGVATLSSNGDLSVSRHASTLEGKDAVYSVQSDLKSTVHSNAGTGIGHTRWATHGQAVDSNAHPHTDSKNRIAIVHNGNIDNFKTLRYQLKKLGYVFNSDTDTEVIVHLVAMYLDKGLGSEDAFRLALSHLEGSWGVAMVAQDRPGTIFASRHGSPLTVGIGQGEMFLASDRHAFSKFTNEYIELSEGEFAVIDCKGLHLDMRRKQVEKEPIRRGPTSPSPFPHWTLKEILQQPEVVARALNFGGRLSTNRKVVLGGFDDNLERFKAINALLVAGSGSSFHAAEYTASLLRWMGACDIVRAVDPAELTQNDYPKPYASTGLLCISQSGETGDLLKQLALAGQLGVFGFSIVNGVGSTLARKTGVGAYVRAGQEESAVATKTFISQCIVGSLVSAWFSQNRQFDARSDTSKFNARREELVDALHQMSIDLGIALQTRPHVKEIAMRIKDADNMFVLGKGFAYPIALEGALKLKELANVHAEGYSGGALKHGPFALIEKGVPIILVILGDEHEALMRTAAEQVHGREGYTILITDNEGLKDSVPHDDIIVIPSNGPLTALLAAVPLQLLAYELALLRGKNPDTPRNVLKTLD